MHFVFRCTFFIIIIFVFYLILRRVLQGAINYVRGKDVREKSKAPVFRLLS